MEVNIPSSNDGKFVTKNLEHAMETNDVKKEKRENLITLGVFVDQIFSKNRIDQLLTDNNNNYNNSNNNNYIFQNNNINHITKNNKKLQIQRLQPH